MRIDFSKIKDAKILLITGGANTTKRRNTIKNIKAKVNGSQLIIAEEIKGELKKKVKRGEFDLILGFNSHSNLTLFKS